MKTSTLLFAIIYGVIAFFISSCEKDSQEDNNDTTPTVSTYSITDINITSAISGGNVSLDGGSAVTVRGVCWNTAPNPTVDNNTTSDGSGVGNFSSIIEGLSPNTTYYVRAYATNEVGTAYGNEISFTTLNEESQVTPEFDVFKIIDGREIRNIIKTSDGGFIGIAFAEDYEVIKFDSDFNILWDKVYGGSNEDYAGSIIQTLDGGYLVAGYSNSIDGDVTGNHGENDIWICKLDVAGNLLWQKSYGGSNSEGIGKQSSILQTNEGGYMFTGYSKSADGDVSANNGGFDIWLVKISSAGDIVFEKTFGGSDDDLGRNMVKTDANFAISIKSTSSNGEFDAPGNWIFQIDPNGNIIWKTNFDVLNTGFINTTSDDNIIVVNNSATQYILNKLDFNGNIVLSNIIDFQNISTKQPSSLQVQETSDQGFIVIGSLGYGNDSDALLFRLTPELNLLYNKIYSGNDLDMSGSIIPISSNNYIYQFFTYSHDIEGVDYPSPNASVIIKLEEFIE